MCLHFSYIERRRALFRVWSPIGPRQPRQGLNQRARGAAVITQQNGMDVIPPSQQDATYLAPTTMQQQQQNSLEVTHIKPSRVVSEEKSELLLDSHQQRVLVSSDASISNGTAAWISSQGHLVTVWTPSGSAALSTGRDQDNNQTQQNSMNLFNARMHSRRNPTVDVCGEAKINPNVAETKT